MGRTKGTYTLTSNIEPKVGAPLDARTIVKLLADLTASNTFEYPYRGMRVFVEENNKSYTLVGSDPTVSSNWTEDGSGGGHVIKNQTGTDMNQRSNLQFVDMTLSDDAINDITKVENIHVIQSESELENLPDGLYMLDDDEGTVIDGNEVGYDNTDSGLRSRNIQDVIDELVQGLPYVPAIYSDEEREIGVWRDGKPLYQKTINVSISNATQWIDTDIDSNGDIVWAEGFLINSEGITILGNSDPSALVGIGTIVDGVVTQNKWSLLYRTTSSILNSGTVYITLKYTKGSDTAGSGTWTTQGGYAHHYSTTEHVVGTWIDGKPLYEKTFKQTLSGNAIQISISSIPIDNAWIENGCYDIGATRLGLNEYLASSAFSYTHINPGSVIDCYCNLAQNATIYITIQYTKTTD